MEKKIIPIYKPLLEGNEKKYVDKCIDSSWISSRGDYIKKFEDDFSSYINTNASTSVSNGTVALHLALLALDIGPGDEVIVPTFTYIASVNAITYVGAKPVFVDSDINTWNLDPRAIEEKVTSRTKAVMVVHLYGNPCDMNAIGNICKANKISIIEDAAEAFGSTYNGRYAGTLSDISTFSFFGNKTITTGEGGMVCSQNVKLIERLARLKSQSVSKKIEYWHDEIGYNYRMTNIQAAIGVAQLEQADNILERKKKIAEIYSKRLGKLFTFQRQQANSTNSYWMVSILAKTTEERNRIRSVLKTNGIETRPFFFPVHKMPPYFSEQSFPVAEELSLRGLNLPSFPSLTEGEIDYICKVIENSLESF